MFVARLVAPDFAGDGLLGHDIGRVLEQQREDAQLHRGQGDQLASAFDTQRAGVEAQIGHSHDGAFALLVRAADQGTRPRFQFLQDDRFDDVVIRTEIESRDLDVNIVLGRQDHDRRRLEQFMTEAVTDRDAIDAGQHQVEDGQVVMVRPELVDGGEAIRGVIGNVTPQLEIVDQVSGQIAIVLDDQNAVRNSTATQF